MDNTIKVMGIVLVGGSVARFLLKTSRVLQAIELCQECLILLNNTAREEVVESAYTYIYLLMTSAYSLLNDHTSGIECARKLLKLLRGLGIREKEDDVTCYIANCLYRQAKYQEAKRLYKKSIGITKETGDRKTEAVCYGNLGTVYESLGEYGKAEEFQRKALALRKEIGDKEGEATSYGNLGTVYKSLSEYGKAEEFVRKALPIIKEFGDKQGEATCYGQLGTVYESLGEYGKAEEFQRKALALRKEIGDKQGEATCYGNLGTVYESLSEYGKAEEFLRKALALRKEIGDKQGEATSYGNLGTVYESLGEYEKAEEFQRKALALKKDIGDKQGEARSYGNLGTVYQSLGEYGKAEEFQRKALALTKEIGDKQGEAKSYGNLGTVYESLGEYGKAEEFLRKALSIMKEIGDKQGEARSYGNLGTVYQSLGEYGKAEEFQRKALALTKEIGDKQGEAKSYGNLGTVYESLGEYGKAEEFLRKALPIMKEIGDKQGEATCYGNLGSLYNSLGKHPEAKEHHEKALAMSREIGDISSEAWWHLYLAYDAISKGNSSLKHEIILNLRESINKCEKIRSFLGRNDQFKISFLDLSRSSYHLLSAMFCGSGNAKEALCVLELGRARALADLISGLHSAEQQNSSNPPSRAEIERIVKKESNCSFLYISYFDQYMFLWALNGNKPILFRKINVNECFVTKRLERNVDEVFSEESFRRFNVLPQEHCEDRSLSSLKVSGSTLESTEGKHLTAYRLLEEEEEEILQPLPTRAERYKMIIAPVADFLDQLELIIVPDPSLYKVPFAALKDDCGNYLSEDYRIRIVPSLTTLGLIQDSPSDYHSQTGALIVGEPDVRDVSYKGCLGVLSRLPSAREEAEMIGKLIGAEPLLWKEATKEAVLQNIHSVSLIHFAAHGDAERGEIALAPQHPFNGIPTEKDYLLTMADISQVQLRAKLVVLSCCHSAQGQVRAEGVVGIARAFLGSGARSVLVALWAIPDKATKELMSHFYEHLVRGASASESLHQAMKWMRNNGYSHVRDWASFMLIGDNVAFDFGK